MNSLPDDRHLGEYRLQELIEENSLTRTWLAEQVSVARMVLVEELTNEAAQASFLASIRAKAAVDHPLIGSIYEAVAQPGLCFCAHELLPGATLGASQRAALAFPAARLAHILRRVCDGNIHHEALANATSPLGLEAIHLDAQGVVRLKNLAIAGPRDALQSERDISHLGHAIVPLVSGECPGASRFLTLLSWMRGEGVEVPLGWSQVRECCEEIEQQLAAPLPPSPATQRVRRPGGKRIFTLAAGATVVVLAALAAIILSKRPPKPAPILRAVLPSAIAIPAGKYPSPDGPEETLAAFRISAHEVTMGEYAEFLEMLAVLAKNNRERTFDHPSQPTAKLSHQPAEWPALLAAAKANLTWRTKSVTLDSPVIGIDWWDATAYAEWKKARLPTQAEWFAALSHQLPQPRGLLPSTWAPLDPKSMDRTPSGLLGMAGSVCEWTLTPAPNPANPLGERLWVLIGGSYLKPGSHALTREWTADRSLHRPDIGFRLVFDREL